MCSDGSLWDSAVLLFALRPSSLRAAVASEQHCTSRLHPSINQSINPPIHLRSAPTAVESSSSSVRRELHPSSASQPSRVVNTKNGFHPSSPSCRKLSASANCRSERRNAGREELPLIFHIPPTLWHSSMQEAFAGRRNSHVERPRI